MAGTRAALRDRRLREVRRAGLLGQRGSSYSTVLRAVRQRFWLIGGLALAALLIVIILAFTPVINRLRHPPSVDFTITGGLAGKMNQLTDWHQLTTACSINRGDSSWSAVFIGKVGADRVAATILVMPYHGPSTYLVGPFDPSGTPVPVHVLLSPLPDKDGGGIIPPPGTKFWRTEPNNPNPPSVPPTVAGRPLGQTVLTLNSDEKSGKIDAPLYNWSGDAPARLSGSFNCGTITTH